MFIFDNTCLLCGREKTPVREHWCQSILDYVLLISIEKFGTSVNTGILTAFLTKIEPPLKMSRSRACSAIIKLEKTSVIKVTADPIDPRKNVAWVKNVERLGKLKLLLIQNIKKLKISQIEKNKLLKEVDGMQSIIDNTGV